MTNITEVQAKSNYADRQQLERAAEMAMRMGQWHIAQEHFKHAIALLPADPHRGEHIDAERYRRRARICAKMATTSKGMRPTEDNPEYRAWAKEQRARQEAEWNEYRTRF